ncbi:uroporphyrinogen-III synthase [Sunxiuqinia sp. A32]|uniref:uroporphyrinogen-III synthase n=1 Tax=Sunxiuqinia sp. A32 TaxID=3461496 RepID=UPI004045E337
MELPAVFIGGRISSLTRKWLESEQIRFTEHPLIRISYRKPDLDFFESIRNESKKWVVTSSYAAHWLVRFCKQVGANNNDVVYCLSEKQEQILSKCGRRVQRPESPKARPLAELIIQQNDDSKVVYLSGNKSLNELPELLNANSIDWLSVEVYQNTKAEILLNEVFDGYLFFSPADIKRYKASGNFPSPNAPVLANGNHTAQAAWAEFPNLVLESKEEEELSFIKYAIRRITEKLNEPELDYRKIHDF